MYKLKKSKSRLITFVPTLPAFAPGIRIIEETPELFGKWLVLCHLCGRVHDHGVLAPGTPTYDERCPDHPNLPIKSYALAYGGLWNAPSTLDASIKKAVSKPADMARPAGYSV